MEEIQILVVDDDPVAARNLQQVLVREGYGCSIAQSCSRALQLLRSQEFAVVLTELRLPKLDGMEILRQARLWWPDAEVLMITDNASVESAVEAMKKGAYHFVAKPISLDEVLLVVREALEKRQLRIENRQLKERLAGVVDGVTILGEDPAMLNVLSMARDVARSDCSVLITGESGTGKELLARYIHENSHRAEGLFKAVNCGVFNEELLANELFGHERGAFTGADRQKVGLIESAAGGTLFLDEITEMSLSMQVKLLRVLQEREVQPVGSTESVKIDVRFLAATNRDIGKMVKSGEFRQDLYFRINVMNLHLPPLSARRRDIRLLAQFFLDRYGSAMGKEIREIDPEAMRLLQGYDFPGNVRELENIIERAVVLARGECLHVEHLPDMEVHTFRPPTEGDMPSLDEQEQAYVEWVLEQTAGNKTKAAEVLGIDRVSLWRKLKKYSLG